MSGWLLLFSMAVALSMDAFSMSLAIAMQDNRKVNKWVTAGTVGIFHMLMPCLGLYGGRWIASEFEHIAVITAGALLGIIGLQMIRAGLRNEDKMEQVIVPRGIGIFIFALLVSLDSFSIGISLGILQAPLYSVLLAFGAFSAFFTWSGLSLGKQLRQSLGHYGEIIGGLILLGFGLKLIL
ncbi:manganese efflux pump MntP [Alteribacillus iranensis]|uniref:Putative Mn2+ efflux pump MntP n=1 Tax=Alteribacillus iranensis TaxID=930128 RepID=A0A1I2BZF1_9BACI|nr:manganese efflux pump [Alteribacillus iranensis]SFE61556.1 Putative Mn2+ efflux pump MntP [Alteribacillus iranensis]